ncbi:hypothetical protein BCR32DRAFT_284619 [Anaeromyces robustus]|uniref:Uncharacterized protein n=1 Tax=Anaeromyces robustus TaxID=1754192 RepID=A0A1Y1WR79_9FUNG|nr:hypothetical protein BCR32DRAFT_284619 [Anaeromyces robustus]|eukprot:ORX76041.1 hypothetical protein BCR32DRAFT_284619 [Anaeromyces robustus]
MKSRPGRYPDCNGFWTGSFLTGSFLTGSFLTGSFLTGSFLTGSILTSSFWTGCYPEYAGYLKIPFNQCKKSNIFIVSFYKIKTRQTNQVGYIIGAVYVKRRPSTYTVHNDRYIYFLPTSDYLNVGGVNNELISRIVLNKDGHNAKTGAYYYNYFSAPFLDSLDINDIPYEDKDIDRSSTENETIPVNPDIQKALTVYNALPVSESITLSDVLVPRLNMEINPLVLQVFDGLEDKVVSSVDLNDIKVLDIMTLPTVVTNNGEAVVDFVEMFGAPLSRFKFNVNVPTSSSLQLENKNLTITSNGTQTIIPSTGYDALASVALTTNVSPNLEDVIYVRNEDIINKDAPIQITPSSGYDGLSRVQVNPVKLESYAQRTITTNGTHTLSPDTLGGLKLGFLGDVTVDVNVTPTMNLETKQLSIRNNGSMTIVPDTGYDGISSVQLGISVLPNLTNVSRTYTTNGTYTIQLDTTQYDGIDTATVNVNVPQTGLNTTLSRFGARNNSLSIYTENDLNKHISNFNVSISADGGYILFL